MKQGIIKRDFGKSTQGWKRSKTDARSLSEKLCSRIVDLVERVRVGVVVTNS